MRKILNPFLGSVLCLLIAQGAMAQFVAFNDYVPSSAQSGTHSNTTIWSGTNNGVLYPATALKQITNGTNLPVMLTITNTGSVVYGGMSGTEGAMNSNSPAYNVFNGYVDFTVAILHLPTNSTPSANVVITFVFTNLNPNMYYKFIGTANRGGGYADRWTKVGILDAASYVPAHTSGVLLKSTGATDINNDTNECVLHTGDNNAGDYVAWDLIRPSANGVFRVYCTTYQGPVPAGLTGGGQWGENISGIRLEELVLTPVSLTSSPKSTTNWLNSAATFTAGFYGVPVPTYQWYRISGGATNTIASETNSSYTISNALSTDNGSSFFAIAQNSFSNQTYTATSAVATLTVLTIPATITNSPQSITVNEYAQAAFNVGVSAVPAPTYQWYRIDGAVTSPIPDQTNASYSLTRALVSDNGARFFVVAQNTINSQAYTATSAVATLTVTPDTTAPYVKGIFLPDLTKINIAFSEALDPSATNELDNFVLTNAATGAWVVIHRADRLNGGTNLQFITAELVVGQTYVLTLNNLIDTAAAANPLPLTAIRFLAAPYSTKDLGGGSPVATVYMIGTNGLDIRGGGTDIGGAADVCQYIYQPKYGDFDVQVRVASMSLTEPFAKAGIMARPSPIGGNSRFAAVVATPNLVGCQFQSRLGDGATAVSQGSFPVNYPYTWLRLQRLDGTNFTGFASVDGISWNLLGTIGLTNMTDPILLGYAVSSRSNGIANSVEFRDFTDTIHTNWAPSITLATEPLGPSSRQTGLSISEVMYNPGKFLGVSNSLEFIEIYSSDPVPVDLSGYRISGSIHFSFPSNTFIQPGCFVVIAREPAFLQSYYGITGVLGPWYANEELAHAYNTTNNNLPQGGTLRLRNPFDAVLLEMNYEANNPWPIAADGTGHSLVLARPSYGVSDFRAWAASAFIGGSPGRYDPMGNADPIRNVVINEFLANPHLDTGLDEFIELYNHDNNPVDISGAWLSDSADTYKFQITNGTIIPALGFKVFPRSEVTFGLSSQGERLFLINSNKTKVIDVVEFGNQSAGVALGRYPDGAPKYRLLTNPTPGTNNAPILIQDIVINEIMYSPLAGDDYQYVELYNKGSNSINLINWKFTHGIDYTFTNNVVMAPDSYIVMVNNKAAFQAVYNLPDSIVFGDYKQKLSHAGERLTLTKPEWLIETNNNGQLVTNLIRVLENEVTYVDGGQWGEWTDGGGSSLELKDPRSDNQQPANWGESDETSKAGWKNFSITITNGHYSPATDNNLATPYNSSNWTNQNRLHVYLLDAGECLVDDIRVITSSNLLNPTWGSFETGTVMSNATLALISANSGFPSYFTTNWVAQGAYDQSTIDETGGPDGSRCLHMRATSHGDPGPNKIRSPYFGYLATGIITIQGSARWMRGWPEIVFRTQGGGYELIGNLDPPKNLGTPGAPNSRKVTNAGPAIWEVMHSPILPAANQPVVITARAYDPDGFGLTLMYRVNPNSAFVALPMQDTGINGDAIAGDGLYSATIPAQPSATIVSFYVQGVDNLGVTNFFPKNLFPEPGLNRCFPYDSFSRECVIRWGDINMMGHFATYHLWMTTNSVQQWLDREPRSNSGLDMTFVYGNWRAIYNTSVKSSGSPFHRGVQTTGPMGTSRVDYNMDMPSDEPILDDNGIAIDMPGNAEGTGNADSSDETAMVQTISLVNAERIGIPTVHRRYVHLFFNGDQRSKISTHSGNFLLEDGVRPDRKFVKTWWPDDADGELLKMDDWFEFLDASNDSTIRNHNARFTRRVVVMDGVEMMQTNLYRFQFHLEKYNGSYNNWSNFFDMINAFSPTLNDYGPINIPALSEKIDLYEWAREVTFRHTVGDYDSWGFERGKNNNLYRPTKSGKWILIPFDLDWGMGQTRAYDSGLFSVALTTGGDFNQGDPRVNTMYNNPEIRHIWLGAYQDMIQKSFNVDYLYPLMDQYVAVFNMNNIDFSTSQVTTMRTFIQQRHDFIQSNLAEGIADFALGTSNNIVTASNTVTLTGTAGIDVKTIKINGKAYPITWTTVKTWSITLNLNDVANTLNIQPVGRDDQDIAKYATNVTITVTNLVPSVVGTIVFNELMYNPTNSHAAFVEIFNRSAYYSFDLSGWEISGLDYTFPAGSRITNGQYLVIAKDRAAFAKAYGTSIPVFDTFNGKFDSDGETLTLIRPALTTNDTDLVVDKVRYEAQRPWPSVPPGTSIQLVDATQDNSRVANWSSGSQWRYFTYTGSIGELTNSAQTLYLYPLGAPCDIYIDNVRLVLGTNAEEGANILRNADFENGDNSFWSIQSYSHGSGATPSVNYGGTYSFHLVSTEENYSPRWAGISQRITNGYVANTNYTLSYWYLSNFKGTNLAAQIGLSVAPDFKCNNTGIAGKATTPGTANNVVAMLPEFPPLWLNEVQPINSSTITNSLGQVAPWVEIYNGSGKPMDLSNYFLANNFTNLTEWAFPSGTILTNGEFRLVWLDSGDSTPTELHAGFTVPASHGSVLLVRNNFVGTNTTVDTTITTVTNVTTASTNITSTTTFVTNETIITTNIAYTTNFTYATNLSYVYNVVTNITPVAITAPQVVDYLNYQVVGNNLSYGAFPDGQPFKRQIFAKVTPGSTNDAQTGVVYINEWMAANSASANGLPGFPNPVGGAYDDWFELYNPNSDPVNLSGYSLTDSTNNPNQDRIPSGYIVPPNGFLMVWADGKPERNTNTRPELHVNFSLAKGGEQIALYDASQKQVDLVVFPAQPDNVSQGRFADGAISPYYYMSHATPGTNNTWALNHAPVFTSSVPPLVFTNGRTYYVTNMATDPDGDQLTYSMVTNWPSGWAVPSSSSGIFRWSVLSSQAQGVYPIRVYAKDNGYPALYTTNTLYVLLSTNGIEGISNTAPSINTIGTRSILLGQSLNFTVTAMDAQWPFQTLSFSLVDPPAGANITADGLFTWTPEATGTTTITVQVVDNASTPLSATRSFDVVVNPNHAPAVNPITDRTIYLGQSVSFTATATDPDVPIQTLAFSLVDPPAGANISTSGAFTWTPSAAGTNVITVRVQDNGLPQLSATTTFTVIVKQNQAPALDTIADKTILLGEAISFTATATDADLPDQTLAYSLLSPIPSGADITTGGLFTWTPTDLGTNEVTVKVADNGVPVLSSTNTFKVIVSKLTLSIAMEEGQAKVSWPSNNAGYQLQNTGVIGVIPGTWTNYTGTLTTNGGTFSVLIPIDTTTNLFLRMVKP
jgi:hypothetical protein